MLLKGPSFANRMSAVLFSIALLLAIQCGVVLTADFTLIDSATGANVVTGTLDKIQMSCIFPEDYDFMRRIAWVESKDGTVAGTFTKTNGKGIWQVDSIGFEDTKNTQSHPALSNRHLNISSKFNINWMQVSYSDLNKPLHCALAARLLLSNKPGIIPVDISSQATYWKTYYNGPTGSGTTQKFIDDTNELESKQGSCANAVLDIAFVIDSSGSIGSSNFENVRNFMKSTVAFFVVGENKVRMAAVQFGNAAQVEFYLNQYFTTSEVQAAIDRIRYLSEGTNTSGGIDVMAKTVFVEAKGARPPSKGVPRVGILFTDGYSNLGRSVSIAASEAQAANIRMFAIGVGSINTNELNIIATDPDCMHTFLLSTFTDVASFANKLKRITCKASTLIPSTQRQITGSLQKDEKAYYESSISHQDGITVIFDASVGQIEAFISRQSPNPSEALYDQRTTASPSKRGNIYFSKSGAGARRKRDTIGTPASNSTQPLYITVQGLQDSGYTMSLADGNQMSGAETRRTDISLLFFFLVLTILQLF